MNAWIHVVVLALLTSTPQESESLGLTLRVKQATKTHINAVLRIENRSSHVVTTGPEDFRFEAGMVGGAFGLGGIKQPAKSPEGVKMIEPGQAVNLPIELPLDLPDSFTPHLGGEPLKYYLRTRLRANKKLVAKCNFHFAE